MAYTLSYSGEQSDEALTIALNNESNILKIPSIENDIVEFHKKEMRFNGNSTQYCLYLQKWLF